MEERVRTTIETGVADVRLARAEKMNALDDAMFEALVSTGERLKAIQGLRAVVISGEGRGFCAGLDMGNFAHMASGGGAKLIEGPRTPAGANRAQQAALVWREIPVPVIAAIHGVAFGGGLQIALGADIRFVAPDAKLSVLEIKWGLVPDMAGVTLLRSLMRDDVVRELAYTGRIFTGEEAVRLGVATRACSDPYTEALATAKDIASKSPDAIRAAKRLINLSADADQHTMLAAEAKEQAALIGSPNQIEAVMANAEKRLASYRD